MNPKQDLARGVALIKSALQHIANNSERGSTEAAVDTAQELITLIDDLPQSVMDCTHPDECAQCHHYQHTIDREPYGDRFVSRDSYECTANGPDDCPAVRRAGLGPDLGIEIPAFLRKQAS